MDAATDGATGVATTADRLATSSEGFVLRGGLAEQLAASNDGYACASNESTHLTAAVSVTCATFVSCDDAAASPAASSEGEERRAGSSAASSSGDSESTAPLLDEGSFSEGERAPGDGADEPLAEAVVQPAPTKKAKTAP